MWLKIPLLLAVTESSFFWVVFLVRTFLQERPLFLYKWDKRNAPQTIELLLFCFVVWFGVEEREFWAGRRLLVAADRYNRHP